MDGGHCRRLLCLLWSLLFNSLTNSILSSSFITVLSSRNDPAGEQPMTDPGELRLQLNIEKRVTAWHGAWIRGGTSISHQSKFSVLIKKKNKNLPVCVCESMCICVPGLPLFSPLVILLTLNHLINFNPFCELTRPSPWSRRLTHTFEMLITSVKEVQTPCTPDHLHTLILLAILTLITHTHNSTSSQCWRVWSIGNPWWRRPPPKKKVTGPEPDGRGGQIMINIHLEVQGAKWGDTKQPGPMIRCDVGCVISCCSNSYYLLGWQDQLRSLSEYFLSVDSVSRTILSVASVVVYCVLMAQCVIVRWIVIVAWRHYQ